MNQFAAFRIESTRCRTKEQDAHTRRRRDKHDWKIQIADKKDSVRRPNRHARTSEVRQALGAARQARRRMFTAGTR